MKCKARHFVNKELGLGFGMWDVGRDSGPGSGFETGRLGSGL